MEHTIKSKEESITGDVVDKEGRTVNWGDKQWVIECTCGWKDHAHHESDVDRLFRIHQQTTK